MNTQTRKATALAFPNLALIKYWGNRDQSLRLPSNDSLSFNLGDLRTTTTVEFDPLLTRDEVSIDGYKVSAQAYERVAHHLDRLADYSDIAEIDCGERRDMSECRPRARVISNNTFPMGVGIASSASGFAALTLAACAALGIKKSESELSGLARLGSGSACRSVPGGFVAWHDGYAVSIAPPAHWPLMDVIAVVSRAHKAVGSTEGHAMADNSPLQAARLSDTQRRIRQCEEAIANTNFTLLAEVIEQDALLMHGVIMTSQPSVLYWEPATLSVMRAVRELREDGLPVAFSIDAGPNVHCICEAHALKQVKQAIRQIEGVLEVIESGVGGPATVIPHQS